MVNSDIYEKIERLLQYGQEMKLFMERDKNYVRNRVYGVLNLPGSSELSFEFNHCEDFHYDISFILNWSYENNRLSENTLTERDILEAQLMDCLLARPSEIARTFQERYKESPRAATEYFYHISKASNYIRLDRIAENVEWKTKTSYGDLDITINLSKPEKDPKEIEKLKSLPKNNYPVCLLCKENEGYKGTLAHPARSNHRIIPVTLNGEEWFMQYSPYLYYQEHSIVFRNEHVPMKISGDTFGRLLEFVEWFPHYFIGSNADLPIVGGSILSHDHFQGGHYSFPIERAPILKEYRKDNVTIGMVKWPMSLLRITGEKEDVLKHAIKVWRTWLSYDNHELNIHSHSNEIPHNTITPIARRRGELFELDMVLRNNKTSKEHPDGIYHPHAELHHIKKENIGLIEVMGLAVLPGRLKEELELLEEYLIADTPVHHWEEKMKKHYEWYKELKKKYKNVYPADWPVVIKNEVGYKFEKVLEHAGVFKQDVHGMEALDQFINSL
ncbi:Galactose-1-phosphate uridylyltransferase [Bacillus sp. THAF10]|uniref:UDP-glucose--hexose-1-phosphate uridylyltransferase n=1 Tax=Bacillus sp. THAF10 TaxID=2587848 RepID=UPI001268D95B|nr:UDP-glucose--hexose-1-phosphate uridylyltransferase [Bacillus sp. THAF10]QFT89485.1 Galactose-1-phosphate uridylyltransferase [Bacillus sp. THAF10]